MKKRLLILSFLEALACILIERGMYFFGTDRLGFNDTQNLWLALLFGVFYVIGAFSSAPLSRLLGPRVQVRLSLSLQLLLVLVFAYYPTPPRLYVTSILIGLFSGIQWPVIVSYLLAGAPPREASRRSGQFSIAWSTAVPFALVAAGPLISLHERAMFIPAILCHIISLLLTRGLPAAPAHLPDDHPERPPEAQLRHCRVLMISSRWLLFSNYALMWILAALFPAILADIGLSIELASGVSAVGDGIRVLIFILMGATLRWHYKVWPHLFVLLALPCGFWLVVESGTLPGILLGQLLFGIAGGVTYMSAFYYAMILQNAAVNAGGGHEGMIGLSFATGPAMILAGNALLGEGRGTIPGACLIIAACTIIPVLTLFQQKALASAYPVGTEN